MTLELELTKSLIMDNITMNKESMLWFFERMHGRLPQSAEEFTEFCKPPTHKPTLCVDCEVCTASVGIDVCPTCESNRTMNGYYDDYHSE